MTIRRTVALPLLAGALVMTAAACDDDDTSGDVVIVETWVREPAEGQTLAAAYGEITNEGDEAVTLVAAETPIDALMEIHETVMGDDDVMVMRERDGGFTIEPGESLLLEPGGPHVMFLDIEAADITDGLEVTYVFDDGTEVTESHELRTLDAPFEPMDDMDMDDMEDDSEN